jgi:hypothetical protein
MASTCSLHNFIHVRNFASHVHFADLCPLGRNNRLLFLNLIRHGPNRKHCVQLLLYCCMGSYCHATCLLSQHLPNAITSSSNIRAFRRQITSFPPQGCSSQTAYRRTAMSSSLRGRVCDMYYHRCEWQRNVILVSALRLPIPPTSNLRSS